MSADESITELAAAVAELGALPVPVPVGSEPQALSVEQMQLRVDEVERRYTFDTAELKRRIAELEAAKVRAAAHTEHLATTLVARTQDLMAAEARVAELEADLLVANGVLEDVAQARREAACPCPSADRPHQVGCPEDGVPVASPSFAERAAAETDPARRTAWRMLAQDVADGEHFAAVHHDWRIGRDLPEMGGA